MGCESVCISGYEGDPAEHYRETFKAARVAHPCYECARIIRPGERYEQVKARWDGNWETYRFCAECSEIGLAFTCDGRTFGNLWEDIEDQVFPELTTVCVGKLTSAKAKCALVNAWHAWKFKE